MFSGELKPVLAALLLPPAGPLLLALFGLVLMNWRWLLGAVVTLLGVASLWFLSCNAVAVGLAQALSPQPLPLNPRGADLAAVQAVVVLGGGVLPRAPEFGRAQPAPATVERIRYGVWLARQVRKPLGFAGGVGWSSTGMSTPPEADVAREMIREDYGVELRWSDSRSRDTAENARFMAEAMRGDRIRRIALVTHSSHMARAQAEFEAAGFQVIAAPTGFPSESERPLLEWLPSVHGLEVSRQVLREWLARRVRTLQSAG